MSEAAGSKPYSEDEAYLYETYVTEDGIEVPPPTKVMGPRRLARYREEVAEYLRAHRRGENPKPVENMGSVVNTGAIDPQVLAVQRRFAALAAQGKIETEANDEEKLHEPAPLTSSLRVLRPDEIAKNRVDATNPSAVDSPLTSSIPVITVVKEEEPEPKMHEYLVRDEPKVDESVVGYASAPAEDEESSESKDAQEPEETQKPEAAEEQKEDASSNLPTRVSAVNAQGLDLSVLDGSVSGDTVDSVDGDPTVALSPDEVEELLQRMVDRQDPEDSVAMAEVAAEEPAESKSSPVASVERADSGSQNSGAQKKDSDKSFAEKVTENQSEHEVLKPAQKTSLAWLWMVLLLALVVVGLIMIFGPK